MELHDRMTTPPRRHWFQFSLATMFVVLTGAAIFFATLGVRGIVLAGLGGVVIGLVMTTLMLVRFAYRLDERGQKYASAAVAFVAAIPLLIVLVIAGAARVLFSLSTIGGPGH